MTSVFCLGSLNLDFVYHVASIVSPGETIKSGSLHTHLGGKGGNQSIALARAGARVYHIGAVGEDGVVLQQNLEVNGVNIDAVQVTSVRTGHAIIQVQQSGQNAIIVEGGANVAITQYSVDRALTASKPGDWLLAQNETNLVAWTIERAKRCGMRVAYNPSPFDGQLVASIISHLDLIILNETEGGALTGVSEPHAMIQAIKQLSPSIAVALTLGEHGAYFATGGQVHFQPAERVEVADTTAAGDTFLGYLLGSLTAGLDGKSALVRASRAAGLCVTRHGAAVSIPQAAEVDSR